jgi:hypothetical protein
VNGYLQRIALSALKPGGSIQPILDSVFSPPNFVSGPQAFLQETPQPVTAPGPSELAPRAELQPSAGATNNCAISAPEPAPKATQSADSINTPIPTSNRFFTPLVPSPKEEAQTLVAASFPAKSGDQHLERAPKPRRKTTVESAPRQEVEDQVGEISCREPAELIKPPIPTSNRLLTPLVPGPKENAKIFIPSLLPAKDSNEWQERAPKPRREITVAAPPAQEIEVQAEEIAQRAPVTKQISRKLAAPAPSTFTTGADRNERMGTHRGRATRSEPDEIQIHIGRIEVVAVPPAPTPPISPKPQRRTPSLDEYLRRRDRKAL